MIKYISTFRLVLRCLLVARKENSTGFSTGLTGRSKNLDPTGNPTGRSTRPVSISDAYENLKAVFVCEGCKRTKKRPCKHWYRDNSLIRKLKSSSFQTLSTCITKVHRADQCCFRLLVLISNFQNC